MVNGGVGVIYRDFQSELKFFFFVGGWVIGVVIGLLFGVFIGFVEWYLNWLKLLVEVCW